MIAATHSDAITARPAAVVGSRDNARSTDTHGPVPVHSACDSGMEPEESRTQAIRVRRNPRPTIGGFVNPLRRSRKTRSVRWRLHVDVVDVPHTGVRVGVSLILAWVVRLDREADHDPDRVALGHLGDRYIA